MIFLTVRRSEVTDCISIEYAESDLSNHPRIPPESPYNRKANNSSIRTNSSPYPTSLKLRLLSLSTAASSRPARTCTRSLAITFLGPGGKNAQRLIACKPHHCHSNNGSIKFLISLYKVSLYIRLCKAVRFFKFLYD